MKRFGFKNIWIFVALWIVFVSMPGRSAEIPVNPDTRLEIATFAGGCFWCMVPPFKKLEGVISVTSGYTGGHVENPTYEQVSAGGTGHAEAVQIKYDPGRISYGTLLNVFWHNIDPTVVDYQFCDHGNQYRSEVFYHTDMQKRLAEESRAALEKTKPFKGPIVTKITPALKFYPAEEYHQDFYNKSPIRYKFYRHRCGRDQRLEELWGKSNTPH
ncbi:MAG: peptide-methionine (S)-S-oxide reductase MsrA [Nitrospirae bacterium]|nr:peptide-methionine (S)-S-oxide reductase MsrA [Nitrospirota bacterium]MBI3351674.1 peptide-methionine (S)-S-oxide reductase MsrA [Nitrospirota bacterium]